MANTSFNPPSWGGRHTNKDYEFMMEGATVLDKPISLIGHALTSPSQNLSDPVTRRYVKKIGGQLKDREEVIRPAEQLSMTYTILFGNGLETPALNRAKRGGAVKTTFYANRLCSDPKEGHAYIYPDGLLNAPAPVNDIIAIEDTGLADWQTELRVEEWHTLMEIFGFAAKAAGGDALYAIAFFTEDCSANQGSLYDDLIVVGGDGTSNPIGIFLSSDRFATNSVPGGSVPSPTGSIGSSVWTKGDIVLIGYSDVVRAAAAVGTTGGSLFSVDAGQSYSIDANITSSIFAVGEFNGQYVVAGGNSGASYLATSSDGVNWVAVTDTDLPAAHLMDYSYDRENGVGYLVAEDGTFYRMESSGASVNIVPITGFTGAPASLSSVDVKAGEHIAIGGPTGYYAETLDGGVTWSSPTVPGTDTVLVQAGNLYRSLVVGTTSLYRRDVLSGSEYKALEFAAGAAVASAITGVADLNNEELSSDELNYFAICTAGGEVFYVKSNSPFA